MNKIYNKVTEEILENILEDLNRSGLFNTYTGVVDLGNGLYQIGEGVITGKAGLEEFDKAIRRKIKEDV